jgi:hypothetical protein
MALLLRYYYKTGLRTHPRRLLANGPRPDPQQRALPVPPRRHSSYFQFTHHQLSHPQHLLRQHASTRHPVHIYRPHHRDHRSPNCPSCTRHTRRPVRASKITLSICMGTPSSKADLFALPIPAEHVTLRIANAALVSKNFTTAITTAHSLPSLHLHQCTCNNWTARPTPTSTGPLTTAEHSKSETDLAAPITFYQQLPYDTTRLVSRSTWWREEEDSTFHDERDLRILVCEMG